MISVPDISNHLRKIAFNEDASAFELFQIAFAFGLLWFVVFSVAGDVLGRWSYSKQWLIESCEREYDRNTKKFLDDNGVVHTREGQIDNMRKDWPFMQVIALQHGIGALLCVPALVNYGDPSWSASLASLAILSEMGWELEHTIVDLIYKRYFTPNGKVRVPNIMMVVFIFHHSLSCSMGLPMILRYRNLRALHWLSFDLQLGGAIFEVAEYSKLLDIRKPNELRQFKICNFVLFVFMTWTRFFHWTYLCGSILLTFYRDENWLFLAAGIVPILVFSLFNALFMVIPFTERFVKFMYASAEYESLPEGTKRRQSLIRLESTVTDLMESTEDPVMAISRRLSAKGRFKSAVNTVIASNRMKSSLSNKSDEKKKE